MSTTQNISSLLKKSARKSISLIRQTRNRIHFRSSDVIIRSDGAGWILDQFAGELYNNLRDQLRIRIATTVVSGVKNRVIHFINRECFMPQWPFSYNLSNKMIGLWWHGGLDSINSEVRKATMTIKPHSMFLAKVHVTCSISRDIVQGLGVPEKKIVFLPMGVNLKLFHPPIGDSERIFARQTLGIPRKRVVIGLFQKDSIGWGDDCEPKLVKGPDIFIQVLARLSKLYPLFALIPGPARGYVIRGLEALGIPYRNDGHIPHNQMTPYYHACDIYMITGREEGGPAPLLEALATGTPVVTHQVGMAPDLIRDGENGYLVDVGDIEEMVQKVSHLLDKKSLRQQFIDTGIKTIQTYDWSVLAKSYSELYANLIYE